jgi:hypothetical protein
MNLLKYMDTVGHLYSGAPPPKSDAHYDAVTAKAKQEYDLKKKLENTSGYVDQFGNRESATDRIQETDRANKKKIIKKEIKVVKKPRPTIQEQLDFQDHLNTLDPYWWLEDEEETKPKVLIRKPRRMAQGIQTILNLHRKKNT